VDTEARQTIPVSKRALIQRISRRLNTPYPGERADKLDRYWWGEVRATRGALAFQEFGEFYISRDGTILTTHVDLEDWGRKLGALHEHEHLVAE